MKNLLRFCALVAFAATISIATTSCSKDTCYECDAYDDGNGFTIDAFEACEGDNGATEEEVNLAVAFHEAAGGTCRKK